MTGMKEREKAFENKYQHDQEVQFKVHTRAVRGLGLWAAEKLELTGDDAVSYAESLVDLDFAKPGVGNVYEKIIADFANKQINIEKSEMETVFATRMQAEKLALIPSE